MTTEKSERLLNLLIMLLVQRHYVAKERIRRIVYPDSSVDAFEKMFERDKDELRSLGVPVEIGQLDTYFDDEPGYRIRPDRFALPAIDLEPDEAAVVGLATRVWEHATLAKATTEAVRKLTAAGVEVDPSALDIAQPRLAADEPAFDVFWEAVCERTPLAFDYQRSGSNRATTRHLQPWGVTRFSGRWYVVGLDTDRGAERVFRLSRVLGEVRRDGQPASYDIPADVDVKAVYAPPGAGPDHRAGRPAGPLGRRVAAAARCRRRSSRGCPVPTSTPAGTGCCWPPARSGSPTRCSASAPTSTSSRARRRCATRSSPGCRRCSG